MKLRCTSWVYRTTTEIPQEVNQRLFRTRAGYDPAKRGVQMWKDQSRRLFGSLAESKRPLSYGFPKPKRPGSLGVRPL
jgi:hypothetical protein